VCQVEQLLPADDLLRVQVEALEEVLVQLAVAQPSLHLFKELQTQQQQRAQNKQADVEHSSAASTVFSHATYVDMLSAITFSKMQCNTAVEAEQLRMNAAGYSAQSISSSEQHTPASPCPRAQGSIHKQTVHHHNCS
jgi:hypothetical protein